jgi:glutathione S-transferase
MITVHHLNNSRSQRILWMLEELGQPYEVMRYERDPATLLAPASLKAVHPLGKSPVLTDGDRTLAESARSSNTWPTPTATAASRPRPAHPSACATPTSCTSRKAR